MRRSTRPYLAIVLASCLASAALDELVHQFGGQGVPDPVARSAANQAGALDIRGSRHGEWSSVVLLVVAVAAAVLWKVLVERCALAFDP
jgi:hypothetical protein